MLASCSGSPGGGASRAVTTISSGAGAKSEGATSDGATFEGTTSEGGPPFDISSASGETEGTSMIIGTRRRSEEHTSELQSLMRSSYAVFCLKKKKKNKITPDTYTHRTQQR